MMVDMKEGGSGVWRMWCGAEFCSTQSKIFYFYFYITQPGISLIISKNVMAPSILKKRKREEVPIVKAPKKIRKQKHYSSPSASSADEEIDEFPPVDLADSESEAASNASLKSPRLSEKASTEEFASAFDSSADSDSDSDASQSSASQPANANEIKLSRSKRNEPAAFASSMSAILRSKLSTSKRQDPVLARSATAAEANASIANTKLEAKARAKLCQDKKEALEKGRVKDILLGTDANGGSVEEMMEEEKRLRKIAQRGVVKLFNAVRQAQVRSEEASRQSKGLPRGRKEEKVSEMSKKGFLELIAGEGKAPKAMTEARIEEA